MGLEGAISARKSALAQIGQGFCPWIGRAATADPKFSLLSSSLPFHLRVDIVKTRKKTKDAERPTSYSIPVPRSDEVPKRSCGVYAL